MVPFTKVESVGNDFVLLEEGVLAADQLPDFARFVSDRHFCVGSDGLLVVGRDPLRLRMFNPDGSEDFCGNGIRCAAHYAAFHGWFAGTAKLWHLDRTLQVTLLPNGSIQTDMPPASFSPESVPVQADAEVFSTKLEVNGRKLEISSLTTGSTHTVLLVDRLPGNDEFFAIGPALEHHPLFPERTSVIWAKPESADTLRLRIWERGAGETMGCGTGSSAAAVVWARKTGFSGTVQVHNPGGTIFVRLDKWNSPLETEGSAKILYTGKVRFAEATG